MSVFVPNCHRVIIERSEEESKFMSGGLRDFKIPPKKQASSSHLSLRSDLAKDVWRSYVDIAKFDRF